MTCDICKTEGHASIRSLGNSVWACRVCLGGRRSQKASPVALKYIRLDGYGKVLESRVREMERRVVIADKNDPNGYHCGRIGERGKIEERSPNY